MRNAAREESAGYYAHIAALDKCIGDLQGAILEAGISENTIVKTLKGPWLPLY